MGTPRDMHERLWWTQEFFTAVNGVVSELYSFVITYPNALYHFVALLSSLRYRSGSRRPKIQLNSRNSRNSGGWGIKSQLTNLWWLPLHYHWSLYNQGQCCKGWRCLPTHKWWATHPFGEFVPNSNSYQCQQIKEGQINDENTSWSARMVPDTYMLWGAMLGLLWGGVWVA